MEWKFDIIGCDIVCCYTKKRKNVLFLEYNRDLKVFEKYSDYLIAKHFIYNDRQYARDKAGNRNKYQKLLSDINFYKLYDFINK